MHLSLSCDSKIRCAATYLPFGIKFISMVVRLLQQKLESDGSSPYARSARQLRICAVLWKHLRQKWVALQLLRDSDDGLLNSMPLWKREDLKDLDLIAEFQREARVLRRAVTGDLTKVIPDVNSPSFIWLRIF